MGLVTHLECSLTGERYEAGGIHNLSRAGKPLLVRYDLEAARRTLTHESLAQREPGMWKWRELLPHAFTYYADDLVLLSWDRALVIEPDAANSDVEYVLEFANAQLLELRLFDDILDRELRGAVGGLGSASDTDGYVLVRAAALAAHASAPGPQHNGTSQFSSTQGTPSSTASTTSTREVRARVRCGSAISYRV